ncbi:hypothetical protein HPB52_019243 [Rhipicephalus sanguineus]|uniref:Phosphatidylethanolamine binding protein n=1 Tax=Rhipicephalus sanguineus TaxID=34632 RepID=A0A9D4PXA9_RHISA|nr:hypothetical protein HPB52_019243 [Rhipicephalus sanguineus]
MGNELEPQSAAEPPRVALQGRLDRFYALCMVDLDAPSASKPKHRAWLHWLVVNIPALKLTGIRSAILPGRRAGAGGVQPPDTGGGYRWKQPHRFQPGNFIFIPMRAAFDVWTFMIDNSIHNITAFNFFRIDSDFRSVL